MSRYLELLEEKKDIESRCGALGWVGKILSGNQSSDEQIIVSVKQSMGSVHIAMNGSDLSSHNEILVDLVKKEVDRRVKRINEIDRLLGAADLTITQCE